MNIAGLATELVATLKGAGLRAAVDPRDLNPPCVWVSPRSVAHDLLGGGGTVTFDLLLIVADNGAASALTALTGLLDQVLTVVDPDADTVLSDTVTLPNGSAPLPAFRVAVDLETCS